MRNCTTTLFGISTFDDIGTGHDLRRHGRGSALSPIYNHSLTIADPGQAAHCTANFGTDIQA